ncbi:MAG: hypothetical protein KF799_15000 [Bdellovibrionales bacterium]|nr:hypothetical protein [Bdellovibrionales bacterium]
MLSLGRALLIYALSAAVAVPPAFAAPAAAGRLPEVPVNPSSLRAALKSTFSPEAALARLTPGIPASERAAHLKARSQATLKGGARIANEILGVQAMIILAAVLSFQASQEHRELVKLSNNQMPEDTTADGACAAGSHSTLNVLLCSGEFWTGAIGGAAFLGANSATQAVMRKFLQSAGSRLAFFKYLSAMSSGAFLMVGAQGASFLWTEAVKALPDAESIRKADGVAGRAMIALTSGQRAQFNASEDGRLFAAINENMWNILVVDASLRSQWMYNTWRFGLARGEFISAMAALMAAASAGEIVTGVAALGWSAPVLGFIVSMGLGFGAMNLLFSADAPAQMTKAMQGMRSFTASGQMRRWRAEILTLSKSGFTSQRYPQAGQDGYIQVYERYLSDRIGYLESAREDFANVAIEKYYELLNVQQALESKIQIAETTVRSAALQKNLFVEVDNKIMSFEQAKAKLCPNENACAQNVHTQLETLKDLKPLVRESKARLSNAVQTLAAEYAYDRQSIQNLWQDSTLIFPFPIAQRLSEFQNRSQAIGESLTFILGGSDQDVARSQGLEVSEAELASFRQDLAEFYTQSFKEAPLFNELKKVAGPQ